MAAKLLLVGLATDGPDEAVFLPKDEKALRNLFGFYKKEQFYITPTASSITLQYPAWTIPTNEVNGRKAYLYSPRLDSADNSIMYFGTLGGTGLHKIDVTYTPYLGQSDLLYAGRKHFQELNTLPYIMRAPGNKATFEANDWVFKAKYSGEKYNNLRIIVTSTSLSVTGMVPEYSGITFTDTDATALKNSINASYNMGLCPLSVTLAGSALLPAGTHVVSGGTDGTLDAQTILGILEDTTIPIDVTHILFLTTLTSSIVNVISEWTELTYNQPRLFLFPAPTYAAPASAWIAQQNRDIPYRNNMIVGFVGNITSELDNIQTTRYSAEGATFAFMREQGYNLTNIKVNALSFSPVLTESELAAVKVAGWVPMMRYIKNDISVYEGVTTYNENSFLYSSKVAEILSVSYDYCYQFIGTYLPEGENAAIANELARRIALISFIEVRAVQVIVIADEMFVTVEAELPSEILSISFTIKN